MIAEIIIITLMTLTIVNGAKNWKLFMMQFVGAILYFIHIFLSFPIKMSR